MAVDGGGRLWWGQGRPEMGLEGDFAGIVVVAGGWQLQQGGVGNCSCLREKVGA